MFIKLKRIYEPIDPDDGCRILVDRLWPRGLSKTAANIDTWAKEVAPSDSLRSWYGHDPDKWPGFKAKYFAELDENQIEVNALADRVSGGRVTFVFAAKNPLNNAVALKEYLESRDSDSNG